MVKDVENGTGNGCKEENDADDEDGPKTAHKETTPTAATAAVVSVVGGWCRSIRHAIGVVHLVLDGSSVCIWGGGGAIGLG